MAGCFGNKKRKHKKKNLGPSQEDQYTLQQNFPSQYQNSAQQKLGNGINSNVTPNHQNQIPDLNSNISEIYTQRNVIKSEKQVEPISPSDVRSRQGKFPSKTSKAQPLVHIGVYLDESHISVGTTDPEKIQPKLLLQHPGQLTLLQDRVEIGKNINTARTKYAFNLHQLLKDAPSSVYEIVFDNGEFQVSPEELLVLFFKTLLVQIKTNIKDLSVGNVIVSTAFLLTSFEKQRLKFAMTAANIIPTRIVTSLLTTAIAEATYNRCFSRSKNDHEYVVVVHSVTKSFSMAIIEVGKDFIFMRRCTGSENYQLPFNKKNAITLYEHGLSDLRIEDYGSDKILEVSKLEPVPLVGKTSYAETMNVCSVAAFQGPFAGACFLACSSLMPQLKLPSNIHVQDASRSDLAVHLDGWRNPREISFKNTSFIRRTIFQDKVSVPTEGIQLTLFELYGESVPIEVGLFRIDRPEWSNEAFLQVLVNQDGMFSVTSKDANVMRLSGFAGKGPGPQMQATKILEYYGDSSKGAANKSKLDDPTYQSNGIQKTDGKIRRGSPNIAISHPKQSYIKNSSSFTTKILEDILTKAVDEGLRHYKSLMTQITDKGEPFSQAQLSDYHNKSMAEALRAFEDTFGCIQQVAALAFASAKANFEQQMQSQLPTLIMRYDITIEKVVRDLQLAKINT